METINKNNTAGKTYNAVLYPNGYMVIKEHDFNPFKNRSEDSVVGHRQRGGNVGDMSRKCYVKTLKRKNAELAGYKFDISKCKFVTLTTARETDSKWSIIKKAFASFLSSVKYNFGAFKYVRAVELQARGVYHIHTVLQFEGEPRISEA
ncbi:hypothetical protein FACS1894211_14370 [Clostridia bacterium]|nr:hypothetical protein FACS1894211_14370 [Clostridia bacterium]